MSAQRGWPDAMRRHIRAGEPAQALSTDDVEDQGCGRHLLIITTLAPHRQRGIVDPAERRVPQVGAVAEVAQRGAVLRLPIVRLAPAREAPAAHNAPGVPDPAVVHDPRLIWRDAEPTVE